MTAVTPSAKAAYGVSEVMEKDFEHTEVVHPGTVPASDDEFQKFDRKMLLKLDLAIIPVIAAIFLMNFLDRSNIGNARVAGMQEELKLTDVQYQTAITATYVLYIAVELPSNLVLRKIGPRIALPSMCVAWGVVTTLQCLVHNYSGLLACRFMLGFAEGGLFPGLVLYLSMFYRRHELQLRVTLFFAATAAAGAFSGLLAAAIVQMDGMGGLSGWQWIFCLEGILTVLVGMVSFYLLPNNPREVRTLTPEQKQRCQHRLTLDVDLQDSEKVSWKAIASAFTTLHIWLQVFQLFCSGCSLFGLAYFTPSLVRALGYGPTTTQLLTVPPFALAFIVSVIVASISDRTRQRGFSAIATWNLALVGLIMFYKTRTTGARYTALFFMITGVYSTAPSLVAWVPNNTAAHTRRATAIAMAFMSTNIGGIVCTWIFPTSDAPYYTFGSKFLLSLVAIAILLSIVSIVLYRRLNAQKDDSEFRQRILQPVLGLEYGEQLQILGDSHPDLRYTY